MKRLTVFGILLLLCYTLPAFSFSMIDQDLDAVMKSAAQDRDGNGKPDGAAVLARHTQTESKGFKRVFTFKVEKYLDSGKADIKDVLKPGETFTLALPSDAPLSRTVKKTPVDSQGDLYTLFLRRAPKGNYIALSMKIAPVQEVKDGKNQKLLVITQPWGKKPVASEQTTSRNESALEVGSSTVKEPLDDFIKRLND